MTKRLFYDYPYATECRARILRVQENEILLDRTVFFAFSGGQASDVGTINGIPVANAIACGDDIVYIMEKKPALSVGDEVIVSIDKERRTKLMRLHSAAHIVHFLFEKKTCVSKLIGSNIDVDKARLDYAFPESVAPLLAEIEESANTLCRQNLEIKRYNDEKTRKWFCSTPLGDIACNCSGTHVSRTSEISVVKLKRKNLGAGKERIEITLVC